MNNRRDGHEIWQALSRFSPDVFAHPVWIDFIKANKPISDLLLHEMQVHSQQLLSEGDIRVSCEALLLNAVLHKRRENYGASLNCLQRAWELADTHQMPDIVEWAAWGSCALHILLRQPDQAIDVLKWLSSQLGSKGDWVLANLLDLFSTELSERTKGNRFIEIPLDWLLSWGELPLQTGITKSVNALTFNTNGGFSPNKTASGRPGMWAQSIWDRVKKIARGQNGKGSLDRNDLPGLESNLFDRGSIPDRVDAQSNEKLISSPQDPNRPDGISPSNHSRFLPPVTSSNQIKQQNVSLPAEIANDGNILTVYCFGSFRVLLDDRWITNWSSGKGKAIFKYLIASSPQPIPKDVLMDTFWREADPEAARNNMYVAIHGLRQAFKSVRPDYNPVLYDQDHYYLNPEMPMWVDVDEFKQRYRSAQRLEQTGRLVDAIIEYEKAESLYLGDFLEDDLYDDWTVPRREGLKDTYLFILDRLSRYYLEESEYITCIQICQTILAKDSCREDAHRRLMRCYSHQGQRHLALRQYHLCKEELARELGVPPAQETTALYHHIRNEGVV